MRLRPAFHTAAAGCGYTALMQAAQRGDLAGVAAAHAAGDDINARNDFGRDALMLAARGGHRPVVEWLLCRGARIDRRSRFGETAESLAMESQDTATVDILRAHRDYLQRMSSGAGFATTRRLRVPRLDLGRHA